MYATVDDLRAEHVLAIDASDARLAALIDEATRTIDKVTGWFFEPRERTFRVDGRAAPTVDLPVPPIRLARVRVEFEARGGSLMVPFPYFPETWFELPRDAATMVIVGAPVRPEFDGARITLRQGLRFPKGHANVVVEGLWGYTEDDGTPDGRTPLAIRRACILLVLRALPPMASEEAFDVRSQWRLLEERTRDQSVRWNPLKSPVPFLTGDPEIDALLTPYVRLTSLGAA